MTADSVAARTRAETLTFQVGNGVVPREVSGRLRTLARVDSGETVARRAVRAVVLWAGLQVRDQKSCRLRWCFESWLHALSQRVCAKCRRVRKECLLRRCRVCSRLFCWPRTNHHFLSGEFNELLCQRPEDTDNCFFDLHWVTCAECVGWTRTLRFLRRDPFRERLPRLTMSASFARIHVMMPT